MHQGFLPTGNLGNKSYQSQVFSFWFLFFFLLIFGERQGFFTVSRELPSGLYNILSLFVMLIAIDGYCFNR